MKRITAIFAIFLALVLVLPGCGQFGTKDKISIVCTVFPQYDWVREILGDGIGAMEVTLLLKNRIDLHNYQPSVDDIVKISNCDLFIYVGGESDGWVDDALRGATNKNMAVLNLLEILGDAAKEDEILEGMEMEHEDDDDHDGHETEYDEHVWLSLKNARLFCAAIAEALSGLDSANAAKYEGNLDRYTEKLDSLDAEYAAAANTAPVKTLLFGDRFPFRYLTHDYGLVPYAAFPGCSAETEASFETIVFLAKKLDELNLKAVVVTESSDKKIAQAIIDNAGDKNRRILVLDAMQSVGEGEDATYLSIMESNLEVLKEALK